MKRQVDPQPLVSQGGLSKKDRPHGVCQTCGDLIALKRDGKLWQHHASLNGQWSLCPGSGDAPLSG